VPAPLEDPAYEPVHRPVNGRPPEVVARWGAASQLRWFRRFRDELDPMPAEDWAPFYCSSAEHRGLCCYSCLDELEAGFRYTDSCCCRAAAPTRP
jgi:hypothetical protein